MKFLFEANQHIFIQEEIESFDLFLPTMTIQEFETYFLSPMKRKILSDSENFVLPLLHFIQFSHLPISIWLYNFLKPIIQTFISTREEVIKKRCIHSLTILLCHTTSTEQLEFLETVFLEFYTTKEFSIDCKVKFLKCLLDNINCFINEFESSQFLSEVLIKSATKETHLVILKHLTHLMVKIILMESSIDKKPILNYFKMYLQDEKPSHHRHAVLTMFPYLCTFEDLDFIDASLNPLSKLFNKHVSSPSLEAEFIHVCRSIMALENVSHTAGKIY
jgi:hypothetical protein